MVKNMVAKNVVLALLVLLAFSGTAMANITGDGALSITNLSISPTPIIAGTNVTLKFQLYNSYGYWLYSMSLQPTGTYPILNVSPASSTHMNIVQPGLDGNFISYTFTVPKTTPAGVYNISFVANYDVLSASGQATASSTMPVKLYVKNYPQIKVTASSPSPAALYTGYNQTVYLVVNNTGYGTARNVTISVSAVSGANLLSSVTSFFISNLTRGQSIREPILVSAKGTDGAKLLANVSYYSSDMGREFTTSQGISLMTAPAAQFTISSQSAGSQKLKPGATDVPVTFTITNTGTSAANQMQVNLQVSYPVTPVASTAYIGSLPAGASANATFLVSIDSQGVPGNYPVTLYEQWKQPNGALNQQFSGSDTYFVPVTASTSQVYLIGAVIAVIVIVAVALRFKKGKTSKRKQKQGK